MRKEAKTYYNGHSKRGGIYKILNSKNGRFYYGSAKEFKSRWKIHLKNLKGNKHSNQFLQSDFNKCGEAVFEFHVIEVVPGDRKTRTAVEDKYLKKFHDKQQQCYNFAKTANSFPRSVFSNNPEETKKKISDAVRKAASRPEERKRRSEASKKMWENPEYRKMMSRKISKAKKGKKRSQEFRNKMSENMKKRWSDPDISEKYLDSFRSEDFKNKMSSIAKENGYQPSFSGRTHSEETKRKISRNSKRSK